MARPKSYDRDEAVMRACAAFWEKGYGALGVRAIEERTGLNQFAIRTEFGGKEGLFLEVLEFYAQSARKTALAPMQSGGIGAIAGFFDDLISATSPVSSIWGCLIVNTGVENAAQQSPRIKEATQSYWALLQAHFEKALQKAVDTGELGSERELTGMASSLVIAVMGIHIANRTHGACDAGAPMVEMIKTHLENWRV